MSEPSVPLRYERAIDVPPEDVYAALTTPAGLSEWLAHEVRLDPQPAGRLYVYWNTGYYATGEVLELEPDRRVVWSWHGRGEPAPTHVVFEILPERGGAATRLVLEHTGVGGGDAWQAARGAIDEGWSRGLDNLVSVLEQGIDLRLYGRAMLGLSGGAEVTSELAAERRLPVDRGVLMTDFVEGMGASAAGLRRGDVLVRLGGDDVDGWESLANALGRHEVGDSVEVTYYRNGDVRQTELTLFGRPRPAVPETAAAAADVLRSLQAEVRAGLEESLAGVAEEVAAAAPPEGGWSALEVLAHLVTTERAVQMWLALRIQGEEAHYWASNEELLVSSLVAVTGNTGSLLAELERAWAQTAHMVEHLPAHFLERRASYTNACDLLLSGLPYHARSHIEQIRECVTGRSRA